MRENLKQTNRICFNKRGFQKSVFVLLSFFLIGSCNWHDSKAYYRIFRNSYSTSNHSLLVVTYGFKNKSFKDIYAPLIYNTVHKSVELIPESINPPPFDAVWMENTKDFVISHGNRLSLFSYDEYAKKYIGSSIACRLDYLYTYCSSNPNGEWLAVNCNSIGGLSKNQLGLYDRVNNKFVITEINMNHTPPVWKDETTVYLVDANEILEVDISKEVPTVSIIAHLQNKHSMLYGLHNGKPLIDVNGKLKLGNDTIHEFEADSFYSVNISNELIFILESKQRIFVYDWEGNRIAEKTFKQKVEYGCISGNPNEMYALKGTVLITILLDKNKDLHVKNIIDLSKI